MLANKLCCQEIAFIRHGPFSEKMFLSVLNKRLNSGSNKTRLAFVTKTAYEALYTLYTDTENVDRNYSKGSVKSLQLTIRTKKKVHIPQICIS
jgi:hypothetical protein